MGQKPLEVGVYSEAAAMLFERHRIERGLSQREMMRGVGMTAVSRFKRLLEGTGTWNLDDVEIFANYLNIPVKTVFGEIIKEGRRLSDEANCPCSEETLAG